jgi:hypothetical protein
MKNTRRHPGLCMSKRHGDALMVSKFESLSGQVMQGKAKYVYGGCDR